MVTVTEPTAKGGCGVVVVVEVEVLDVVGEATVEVAKRWASA